MKTVFIEYINKDDKNENLLAILNTICGLNLNTKFTIGILNDFGKIKFYIIIYDDNFSNIFINKINSVYDDVSIEEFNRKYFIE